ncbi:putative acyl-CoA thioesterase 9 [Toxoplasma gondii TgCatPRC2]|uniref:HotDog ACOT-type domain-containing protein n=3 Tax=Toxoplasma gondii TaxID=5811 RepID=S8EZA3_TOXGM|nr:hypothetical protein TGME49_265360 [Toxoplasma gondii ME49]EPT27727.1 hypothetical protein TGME49_265360 [Toxoplasma gondii ME49]KYF45414.1 putative acyl-CoA thioesterase [Toxoplasma gondii ARI]KYK64729.1 putative acyl-CoA thioesterase 9 [Toxoplasma gondii TgCatPRC2]|eukprot:XP_018636304.1 hypothetical protein TGME49_265360 [Toxoplasma gondii ME49]
MRMTSPGLARCCLQAPGRLLFGHSRLRHDSGSVRNWEVWLAPRSGSVGLGLSTFPWRKRWGPERTSVAALRVAAAHASWPAEHAYKTNRRGFSTCDLLSGSSLRDIKEVPVTKCLMTKWVLERIGADSAALRCFTAADTKKPTDGKNRSFFEGWMQARIGFASHPSKALRDAFRRSYDARLVRWGRLLEVLDCFAGDIAYHYCTPEEEGYSKLTTLMVTASIQRMEFSDAPEDRSPESCVLTGITVEDDLTLIGSVTQTGASSMGIRIEMQQNSEMKGSVFFVMVSVDETGKPVKKVPPLDISSCSPELRSLIASSSSGFETRKANAKKMFSLVPPEPEEAVFLHNVWKKSLAGGKHMLRMRDTKLSTAELIQPEALSRYNRAFGGLVSRKALELSYLNAQRFLKTIRPVLTGVDDIFFLQPLFVGQMAEMVSCVVWSEVDEVQIQVEAFCVDPVSGNKKKTNIFHFRYDTVVDANDTWRRETPQKVYPSDYADCISFLEARRRYLLRKSTSDFVA